MTFINMRLRLFSPAQKLRSIAILVLFMAPVCEVSGQQQAARIVGRVMVEQVTASKTSSVLDIDKDSGKRYARSVIIGIVFGGAVGAIVGHEVGKPQSCPTSSESKCDKPRLNTLSGTISGAIIGGIGGYIENRWLRH